MPDFELSQSGKDRQFRERPSGTVSIILAANFPNIRRVRDYIIRADPLPRTATRKIKRFELIRTLENGNGNSALEDHKPWTLSAADRELLQSNVGRAVVAVVRNSQKDPGTTIHPGMNLEIDLGLDSLARAETSRRWNRLSQQTLPLKKHQQL